MNLPKCPFSKTLKACSYFMCIGTASVKTKLFHPSLKFLHKQFGERYFCTNRIGSVSQLVQGREPPNKLAADTVRMPKGVPSENLKYRNYAKQF